MSESKTLLVRLGLFLSTKKHFVRTFTIALGLLFAIWAITYGSRLSPWFPVFALPMGFVAGYLWSLIMWSYRESSVKALRKRRDARQNDGT